MSRVYTKSCTACGAQFEAPHHAVMRCGPCKAIKGQQDKIDMQRRKERGRAWYRSHVVPALAVLGELRSSERAAARSARRAIANRRRARLAEAPVNDLTPQQWAEVLEAANGRCYYCGGAYDSLTMDHVTPLARGGSHTKGNIVAACKSCNSSKGAKLVDEWRASGNAPLRAEIGAV